jgi:TolA-binding protein
MINDQDGRAKHAEGSQWHRSEWLTVTHILATLALFGTMLVSANNLQDQVVKNTANNLHQKEIIERVEKTASKRDAERQHQLDRMDSKLDRLLDRELKRTGH